MSESDPIGELVAKLRKEAGAPHPVFGLSKRASLMHEAASVLLSLGGLGEGNSSSGGRVQAAPDGATETQGYLDEANRQLIALRLNRLPHADLCRLSIMFGRSSDLRTDQDQRINEWLKAQIADAKGKL